MHYTAQDEIKIVLWFVYFKFKLNYFNNVNKKYAQFEILGGTQRLSRVVGLPKAKELIFTSAKLTGEEAQKIGLVNYVVEDPLKKSLELSKEILKAVS